MVGCPGAGLHVQGDRGRGGRGAMALPEPPPPSKVRVRVAFRVPASPRSRVTEAWPASSRLVALVWKTWNWFWTTPFKAM